MGISNSMDVRRMLSKKMEGVEKKMRRTEVTGISLSVNLDNLSEASAMNHKARAGLESKLNAFSVAKSGYSGEYVAEKYLGKPISSLIQEEKKLDKQIKDTINQQDELVNKFYQKYYNSAIRVAGSSKRSATEYAWNQVKRCIISKGAETQEEKEAHIGLSALDADLSRLRVEYNAVQVAKQAYKADNEDLIQKIVEEQRRKDLMNSGFLDELGLKETSEEKKEEEEEKKEEEKVKKEEEKVKKEEEKVKKEEEKVKKEEEEKNESSISE